MYMPTNFLVYIFTPTQAYGSLVNWKVDTCIQYAGAYPGDHVCTSVYICVYTIWDTLIAG